MTEPDDVQAPVEVHEQEATATDYVRAHDDPYAATESLVCSILRMMFMHAETMPSNLYINNLAVRLTLIMYMADHGSMPTFTNVDTIYERLSAAISKYHAMGMSVEDHTE
jgi:hypothetical protein